MKSGFRVLLLFISAAALLAAGILPTNLKCEYRVNPLGVDVPRPRLSWTLDSTAQGERQSAYQVTVSSSPGGAGDVWNTGKVGSSEMNQLPYGGAPLPPARTVYWRVRVWDRQGKPSPWSAPASWTTGLQPSDWSGKWIGWKSTQGPNDPLPVFRKQFSLGKPVKRALAFVSGLGFFELSVNGRRAGDNVLDPGWTNYRKTALYVAHDVTPLLRSGANRLDVMLGNGMYNVAGGRYIKFKGSFGPPTFILQLHVEYADGASADIVTDSSWQAAPGPIVFSCIYGGEDYDARRDPVPDSAWQPALVMDGPGGRLTAQSAPPIRVMRTYPAVKITHPTPGITVYDLGQNMSGWPRLTVQGPAGATVTMTPGELLDDKGLVTQRSSGKGNSYSYTLKGQGVEVWNPRFSYYGFRYVQVETTGGKPTRVAVEGQFTHSSAAETGAFQASNQLLNRIQTLVRMAIRSNMQSVLTDCPHREKLGWLEEAHLVAPSIFFSYDAPALYNKIARDVAEAQRPNGLVPDIAPEYTVFEKGFLDSPEWGSVAVIAPWLTYQWYGDKDILRFAYPTMQRYVDYLAATANSEILTQGLGDWYDIGPKGPGPSQLTPMGVTATGFQYQNLALLEEIAHILDRPDDSLQYHRRAERLRQVFNREFLRNGNYATGSQTANALPLVFGIAPDESRPAVLDHLVGDIRARGNRTSAGDIGYRYVIRALTDGGRSGVLYDMATQTTAPSYGDQLNKGATTLTEAWDCNPASSQNHFMLGHILEWFYTGLAGISPDPAAPGFRRVLIKPQPAGDLTWVNAHYDSIRGRIVSNWKLRNGTFTLHVHIPANSTGMVHVPGAVTAGATAAGVKLVRQESSFSVFAVESGDYDFSAKL